MTFSYNQMLIFVSCVTLHILIVASVLNKRAESGRGIETTTRTGGCTEKTSGRGEKKAD